MFRNMAFTNIYKEPIQMNQQPLEQDPELLKNTIRALSKAGFAKQLESNPGGLIIKFGAEWCGPCKKIEGLVYDWFSKLSPDFLRTAMVDIDDEDSFDLYAFLKNKKMINGVPTILFYKKGNLTYIPDDSVVGADPNQVNLFFQRIINFID